MECKKQSAQNQGLGRNGGRCVQPGCVRQGEDVETTPLPCRAQRLARGVPAHLTFIFREWICMILARASSLGMGNSIFRSRRPERSNAGSKMSTLLVAAIT